MKKLKKIYLIILLGSLISCSNPTLSKKFMTNAESNSDNSILNEDHWKQIGEMHDNGCNIMQFIPKNQTIKSWNEMLTFTGIDFKKTEKKEVPNSAEDFVKIMEQTAYDSYPGGSIEWNVLSKDNENDLIFEWKILEPYKGIETFQEISRIRYQLGISKQITYVRKTNEFDIETQDVWVKKLKSTPF